MRLVHQLSLILLLGLADTAGGAEIYRWIDESGAMHFTQSLEQVPPRYRKDARESARKSEARSDRVQIYTTPAAPAVSRTGRDGTLRIPFQRYGHLMKVDVKLNDHLKVPFLIDTGASGVALPAHLADDLGIRVGPKTPRIFVSTANGVTKVPIVMLRSVELGGARVEGLRATLNPNLEIGLLGGSFFNNFVYGVDAAASVITLERNDRIVSGLDEVEWRRRFKDARAPLEQLESYLEHREIKRAGRRRELEGKLTELKQALRDLDHEANRAGVPRGWRR